MSGAGLGDLAGSRHSMFISSGNIDLLSAIACPACVDRGAPRIFSRGGGGRNFLAPPPVGASLCVDVTFKTRNV